jgi:hypothetical protein
LVVSLYASSLTQANFIFQVHGAMQDEDEVDAPPQATTNAAPTRKKSKPHSEASVEDRLLRWVQSATEG